MFAYVLRRVLATIPLLMLTLYLVHVGVSATTNPLADFYLCLPKCQQGYDRILEVYNLDVSIWLRPFLWFQDAATGDLGFSSSIGLPVSEVLRVRGWNTAMIAVPAFIFGSIIALLLSVYSARRQYSFGDYFFTGVSFIGFAFPSFVMALLLQNIFGVQFENWFGVKPFNTGRKTGENVLELLRDITLPATSLAILGIAADSRFGRAAMLETLNQDYIRTARAKGLNERRVVWRHALRNALIPIVTIIGLNFGAVIGSTVVTETVFNWPGIGQMLVDAVRYRDYPIIQSVTLLAVVSVVLVNFAAEILISALDPRVGFD